MGQKAMAVQAHTEKQGLAPRAQTSFDAIRLLAAFGVLVSHHFLVDGRPQPTVGAYGQLGPFCIYVFFAISGYFIAGSWFRNPDTLRYWAKRSLRIFPALFATVLLTVFVIGPLATVHEIPEYFADLRTWSYLKNALLIFGIQYDLPGVFADNLGSTVNLSLWSLPLELAMYAVLGIGVLLLPDRSRITFPVLAVASGFLWFVAPDPTASSFALALGLGATFFTGATIYAYGMLSRLTNTAVISAGAMLGLGAVLSVEASRPILWVALPIVVLGLGSRASRLGTVVARTGDISYGVYLWAFPIQQLLIGAVGFAASMALAVALTTVAGWLSMKLIEVRALALRPR